MNEHKPEHKPDQAPAPALSRKQRRAVEHKLNTLRRKGKMKDED